MNNYEKLKIVQQFSLKSNLIETFACKSTQKLWFWIAMHWKIRIKDVMVLSNLSGGKKNDWVCIFVFAKNKQIFDHPFVFFDHETVGVMPVVNKMLLVHFWCRITNRHFEVYGTWSSIYKSVWSFIWFIHQLRHMAIG